MSAEYPIKDMKILKHTALVSCFFILNLALSSPLASEEVDTSQNTVQSGEISVTLEDEKTKRTYEEMTSDVIQKLRAYSETGALPTKFDSDELYYLAAVHLHCTLRSGVCRLIPETLFEVDLLRAIKTRATSCPSLTPFWKHWVDSDMERRVELNIKLNHIQKRAAYKKQERPKLLRCKSSIETLIDGVTDSEQYLTKRYEEKKKEEKTPFYPGSFSRKV